MSKCIKQNIWVILALSGWLVMASSALAASDGESYTSEMSKDAKLCNAMLALYNADMKTYKEINYDQHEIFTSMWEPVLDNGCLQYWRGIFDINNDGKKDVVVKQSACLSGTLTDSLFIYPGNSDVLTTNSQSGNLNPLKDTDNEFGGHDIYLLRGLSNRSDAWIGGHFVLNPFILEETSYISITDQTPRWIVIAKYKQAKEMQDICYFFNPNIKHQR